MKPGRAPTISGPRRTRLSRTDFTKSPITDLAERDTELRRLIIVVTAIVVVFVIDGYDHDCRSSGHAGTAHEWGFDSAIQSLSAPQDG